MSSPKEEIGCNNKIYSGLPKEEVFPCRPIGVAWEVLFMLNIQLRLFSYLGDRLEGTTGRHWEVNVCLFLNLHDKLEENLLFIIILLARQLS